MTESIIQGVGISKVEGPMCFQLVKICRELLSTTSALRSFLLSPCPWTSVCCDFLQPLFPEHRLLIFQMIPNEVINGPKATVLLQEDVLLDSLTSIRIEIL